MARGLSKSLSENSDFVFELELLRDSFRIGFTHVGFVPVNATWYERLCEKGSISQVTRKKASASL